MKVTSVTQTALVPQLYTKYQPRADQRKALTNFTPWFFNHPNPQALIALACGVGKTMAAAFCIDSMRKQDQQLKTLWLIDRTDLVRQAQKDLQAYLGIPIGIEMNTSRITNEAIVVASVQSLHAERLMTFRDRFQPNLIVVDEAHLGSGAARAAILQYFQCKILNLTGTPSAGTTYTPLDLGEVLVRRTMDEAIKDKLIVPPILAGKLDVNLSRVRASGDDYSGVDLGRFLSQPGILKRTADAIVANFTGQKTMIFAASVEHGQAIAGALYKQGLRIPQIYHNTPEDQRASILAKFKEEPEGALINNLILTKGFNEPSITQLFQLRPTKIPELFQQIIARAIRTDENNPLKTHCRIFEINNTGLFDKSQVVQIPMDRQAIESVRQMQPVSQAAVVLSYLFNKQALLSDPIKAIRDKGALLDVERLHAILRPHPTDTHIASLEKEALQTAINPVQPQEDTSIKTLLAATHTAGLDEFLYRMDDAGWAYFPTVEVPVQDHNQITKLLQEKHENLVCLKKDYNLETFNREVQLTELLGENGLPLAEKLTDWHGRTAKWFRPLGSSPVPYWIKPLTDTLTAIRIDDGEKIYRVYDAATDSIRPMTSKDVELMPIWCSMDPILVKVTPSIAKEAELTNEIIGQELTRDTILALELRKTHKTEITKIKQHVLEHVQKVLQAVTLVL